MRKQGQVSALLLILAILIFFLIQDIFSYLSSSRCCCCHSYPPYLVSFFLFLFYLFIIYSIYIQSKYSMKVGSPLPLLSTHNQPPPPSCHLDPSSPGFVSADQMPSKRMMMMLAAGCLCRNTLIFYCKYV